MVLVTATDATGADGFGRQDSHLVSDSFTLPARIDSVDPDDMPVIRQLADTWKRKYPRNKLRTRYYLAHYHYKGIAYSIPDSMRSMAKPMVGWPSKAVRALADLSVLEGFDAPDSVSGLVDDVAAGNHLPTKIGEAIVSAYMHGCSFLTLSADPQDGSPVITPRSADWSAALWDWEHDRIAAAMTISDKDKDGHITGFVAWLPGKAYDCRRDGRKWVAEPLPSDFDRPTVVPLVHDPQLFRPLGTSRITRPLMALTDYGLRTLVRMEATAEFYAAPRIWFLGANKSQMSPDSWSSITSVINGVPANKQGDKPELRQLSQASMQPHADMLKTIALMVSSETDIPVNELGITMDNPASAEAMAMAERKLSKHADRQNQLFSDALRDLLTMAALSQDGSLDETDLRQIRPLWAPTKEVSDAARADYYQKIASVNPSFADSDVGLTKAGLTWQEIQAQRAWEREQRTQQAVDNLRATLHVNAQERQQSDEEVADGQQAAAAVVGGAQPGAA